MSAQEYVVRPVVVRGRLAWTVRSADGREAAVVDDVGHVHVEGRMTRPFEAVVRALGEWYAADHGRYGGANAEKVKRALSRGG